MNQWKISVFHSYLCNSVFPIDRKKNLEKQKPLLRHFYDIFFFFLFLFIGLCVVLLVMLVSTGIQPLSLFLSVLEYSVSHWTACLTLTLAFLWISLFPPITDANFYWSICLPTCAVTICTEIHSNWFYTDICFVPFLLLLLFFLYRPCRNIFFFVTN